MQKNYKVIFPEQCKVALVEWDVPQPAAGEILVRTLVSQISTGTELTMLEANVEPESPWHANIEFPNYNVGYSNVGRVIAVGEGVDPALIGRLVASGGRHQKFHTLNVNDYQAVKWVPEGVHPEDAVFSTIGSITNGSVRCAQPRPGDVCLVYGAGIIGQMVARFARLAGAGLVIVADVSDFRLSKLPKDPCFLPVNSAQENIPEWVKQHTPDGEGADIVYETTGVAFLVHQETLCLRKMGKLVVTSSPKGKSLVDLDYCNRKGITIIGAHNFAVHPPVETPENRWTRRRDSDHCLEMLRQKRISVSEMHTHRFHYTDAAAAYEMLMKDRSQALSVLLTWEDEA